MTTTYEGLAPSDIGLPNFKEFRPIQLEATEQAIYGDKRFQLLALPTGSGKTLVAMMVHKLSQWRTAYLTKTKGLGDQTYNEFGKSGLYDIRGKANYRCTDNAHMTCRDGQKVGCRLWSPDRDSQCTYDLSRHTAKSRQLVSTNYAYWLNAHDKASGLSRTARVDDIDVAQNPFECLILDECHSAPDSLAEYLAIRLYEKDLKDLLGVTGLETDSISEWKSWSEEAYREAGMQLSNMERILAGRGGRASKQELEHAAKLESLVDKLEKLKFDVNERDWVCEYRTGNPKFGRSWEFDIVWPGMFAERYLFLGIPRVILMSATVRPKTAGLLGIRREDCDFREWSRIFPASRGPIYHYPAVKTDPKDSSRKVMVNIRYGISERDLDLWLAVMAEIAGSREDIKGVIHTTSYEYQKFIAENFKWKERLIGNRLTGSNDGTAQDAFHDFKKSKEPLILLSPSFGTGWDFTGKLAEFQIISKVPFKPMQSKVMKARLERDESYGDYLAIQDLVQWCGRIQRFLEDIGETFVCDGALTYLLQRGEHLAPRGFKTMVQRVYQLPKRLPKLV